MRSRNLGLMLAGALGGGACAGVSGPAPTAPYPAAPAAPVPVAAEPAEPAPAPVEPAPEPEPATELAGSNVAEACEKLCTRVKNRCTEFEYLTCRGRCTTYLQEAAYCEDEVRKALECNTRATDARVCESFAADSCYGAFAAARACQQGHKAPGQAAASAGPPGWRIVVDEQLGFAIELPPGAEPTIEQGRRVWRGRDGRVSYYVAALPAPGGVSEGKLLRLALEHVGPSCQQGFHMRGRFDSGGLTGESYTTSCADGSRRQGALRIRGDRALVIGFQAPPGETGDLDPVLSTFEMFEK